jgi:hypothetical protein
MDKEQIEARARDCAHSYILICLLGWFKQTDPFFVSEIGRSFDEYIGKHEPDVDNAFKKQLLNAARDHLRGLLNDEAITVRLKR